MKILITAVVALQLLAGADMAGATYADKLIAYGGGGQGKVIFDGRTHAAAGILCTECHPALFATRKQALLTKADHDQAKGCFACHNGSKVFAECGKCHRK
ncbi:MAG TPA: c(7)-type cytochrome triheme domain-containing protein [Desulfuromonadaceae bacterium]|jgi:thiosulfate reductase cytochrome b subunit